LRFYKFSHFQAVQGRERGFRQMVERAGRKYHLIDWQAASRERPRLDWFDWSWQQNFD
jgi:hypothetical protein